MSFAAVFHASKALSIQKAWGTPRAAAFLRNKGIAPEEAVLILATPACRAV